MKIYKYLTAAAVAAMFATSCYEGELYDEGPDWVADKIAEEAAKKAANQGEGAAASDDSFLLDDIYQAGKTDNSSGWWGDHSKYYRMATSEDSVIVKFKFFTASAHVWNVPVIAITTDDARGGANYREIGLWRMDNFSNFAWGNENGVTWNTSETEAAYDNGVHAARQTSNYETDATADDDAGVEWNKSLEGADCRTVVKRSGDKVTFTTTMKLTNGQSLTKTAYVEEKGLADQAVRMFYTLENAHLAFYKYFGEVLDEYVPSQTVDPAAGLDPDEAAIASLTVTGPETVPFGTTYDKVLEQIAIKVTYDFEGETREKALTPSDVIITLVPDMSTVGKKTLSVYYNTTLAGNFQQNVKADLVFEVTPLSVNALAIKSDLSSAYYFTGADPTKVFNGFEVDGVQSNGDAIKLDNSTLVFTKVDGNGNFNVSYTTSDGKNLSANGKFGGEKLDNVVSVSFDDCTIQGGGKFVDDATFGKVFENDNSAQRSSYLMLPAGTIQDCSKTGEMTISFWVNGNGKAVMWSPLFAAYAAAPVDNTNTFPMFIIQGRGLLQTNIEGYNDFTAEQNVAGANTESIAYLEDNQWHLVTVTITDKHAEFIVDNTVVNAWNYTGEGNGNVTAGFLTKGHEMLTYICLGGNQAWNWGDPDTGYKYAKLKTYNRVISAEEIAKRIADKE